MFNKSKITTILKEHNTAGVIPQVFTDNVASVGIYEKLAFLLLAEKAMKVEIKELKKEVEDKLNGDDVLTTHLEIKYKKGYERVDITKEGKEYLITEHAGYTKVTNTTPSYSYKLR